jgi:NAD(P)-dependent dehydrogenase (short-subunit alcohol dehydrogenase family)
VALHDIEQPVAEAEARALRDQGARSIALGGDIGDPAVPEALVRQTVDALGGLHVLINNAAIQKSAAWTDFTREDMLRIFAANQAAPLALCQLAAPIFERQRFGRIINLGSIQQLGRFSGMLPYAMSKGALVVMTRALARQLAGDGITVNLIAPGMFNTFRNRHQFRTQEDLDRSAQRVPLGRVGEPRDCAGVALMLCSDAASYITGQVIYVDGGLSIH